MILATFGVVITLCAWSSAVRAAELPGTWELTPYRIQASVALDVSGGLASQLAAELPTYLTDRARTAFGSVWRLDVRICTGAERHRLLRSMKSISLDRLPKVEQETDKVLLLAVRETSEGYQLVGREYDCYLQQWGDTLSRHCRQHAALPEQLFQFARQVIAPLVQLRLDPDDDRRVALRFRGSELPHKSVDLQWAEQDDVFLPVMRRITREGQVLPGGIQRVRWTYVQVVDVNENEVVGKIYSGTRRPLSIRQRGRIEQLAIGLRTEPRGTVVRLRSRTNADKPLIGYELYAQNTGEEATRLIGRSNGEGNAWVGVGDTRVQLLYVKSGGELLARVPVVAGAEREVDVPLPDDELRLQAEARLEALREDLIDVVARRGILMARVRQMLDEKDFRQARELLSELDDLPGRAHFNRELILESRLQHSDDPTIQRRIDQLFTATQIVLGQFLDTRPIGELQDELSDAEGKGT